MYKTIVETTKQNRGEGDFDVFPSAFVNGSKEANELVVINNVIKKVCKGANERDDDCTNNNF